MAHPVVNTKVEKVVEAWEEMALACAGSIQVGGGHSAYQRVVDARAACAEALREFLQPALRVVSPADYPGAQ